MLRAGLILTVIALVVAGCKEQKPDYTVRQWTDREEFRINVNPLPPVALERTEYTIRVLDKETREPVVGGEGRIFATSQDGANTNDNLAPGKEPGTYTGRLFYVVSGDWAIAIQFRRDSTQKLDRVDWVQTVKAPSEPGQ